MAQQSENSISILLSGVNADITRYDCCSDPQVLDHLVFQLELLQQYLLAGNAENDAILLLAQAVSAISSIYDSQISHLSNVATPINIHTNGRGRPALIITEEQLIHLLSLGFNCPTIASMLGASLRTVRRSMTKYGLSVSMLYTNISDDDLDSAVVSLKEQYPNSGYRMMKGLLMQQGIRVQDARIRDSMHCVDPCGIVIRWQACIRRRQYNISKPLELWHIDGNHKLIR